MIVKGPKTALKLLLKIMTIIKKENAKNAKGHAHAKSPRKTVKIHREQETHQLKIIAEAGLQAKLKINDD